jgi:hypothetical protein
MKYPSFKTLPTHAVIPSLKTQIITDAFVNMPPPLPLDVADDT